MDLGLTDKVIAKCGSILNVVSPVVERPAVGMAGFFDTPAPTDGGSGIGSGAMFVSPRSGQR
jgi:hypothetical protein